MTTSTSATMYFKVDNYVEPRLNSALSQETFQFTSRKLLTVFKGKIVELEINPPMVKPFRLTYLAKGRGVTTNTPPS